MVKLLPASEGTGLKAGSSIRSVLELAGYSNILSKMVGSNNKLNNALTTIRALSAYKHADYFSSLKVAKAEEVEEKSTPSVEEKAGSTPKKAAPEKLEKEATEEKAPVKKAAPKKAPAKKVSSEETAEKED